MFFARIALVACPLFTFSLKTKKKKRKKEKKRKPCSLAAVLEWLTDWNVVFLRINEAVDIFLGHCLSKYVVTQSLDNLDRV